MAKSPCIIVPKFVADKISLRVPSATLLKLALVCIHLRRDGAAGGELLVPLETLGQLSGNAPNTIVRALERVDQCMFSFLDAWLPIFSAVAVEFKEGVYTKTKSRKTGARYELRYLRITLHHNLVGQFKVGTGAVKIQTHEFAAYTNKTAILRNSQAVGYGIRASPTWVGFAAKVWRMLRVCFLAVETTDLSWAKI